MEPIESVLYEVYEKRALWDGIDGLPLLDRGTLTAMKASADKWGGLVVRITCNIITVRPMQREVIRYKVVYMHKVKEERETGVGDMTGPRLRHMLKCGQVIQDSRRYKKRR